MNKVLVNGAAGQVVSHAVRQLPEKGCEVKAAILPDDPTRDRLGEPDTNIYRGQSA